MSTFGLGYRSPFYKHVTDNLPQVDFFEIITENFIAVGGQPRAFLEKLRANYPVAMHGVSLSIASTDPVNLDYLQNVKALVDWLDPILISDHYCWTGHNSINTHDLLPAPYTIESLKLCARKIMQTQDFLKRPLLLENPSMYVDYRCNEMSEAEFLSALTKSTGCRLLLDINNVYVNWKNLGRNPVEYILGLPNEAVLQFHVAGHAASPGITIDTHDSPVCDEVWELYQLAVSKWPTAPTLLEWDDKIPDFIELQLELEKAKSVHSYISTLNSKEQHEIYVEVGAKYPMDIATQQLHLPIELKKLQSEFQNIVLKAAPINSEAPVIEHLNPSAPVLPLRGLCAYHDGYFLRLHEVLKNIFPALHFITEEDGFHDLVEDYLKHTLSSHFSVSYIGQNFPSHIAKSNIKIDFGVPFACLGELADFEWRYFEFYISDNIDDLASHITYNWDILTTWEAIVLKKETPLPPLQDPIAILFQRKNNRVHCERVIHQKNIQIPLN